MRLAWASALACALACALCAAAVAAPADLDRTFGGDGIVRVRPPSGATIPGEAGARMAIGPEDEVLVLFSSFAPCTPPFNCPVDLALLRYDRDGDLDPSYGVGPGSQLGVRQTTFNHSFDLAVGPDGKPVVAAIDASGLVVARFDLAGHLDGTFGAGGEVGAPEAGVNTEPVVAVQSDGKILVAGEGGREEAGSNLVLLRFLSNGELDAGFGSGGKATLTLGTRSHPAGIMLGADGAITVAAPQCCGGSALFGNGISLARFLPNGQPDPGLAGAGRVLLPTPPGVQGTVEAAALGHDGSVFISFEEHTPTVFTVGNLTKLLPGGGVDPGFGGEGRTSLYERVGAIGSRDLAVDASGRLVGVSSLGDVSIFRLRADGGKDRTFNGGQQVTHKIGVAREIAIAVGIQSDGRIVALGESDCCSRKVIGLIALRGGTDRSRCQGQRATIVGTRRKDELIGTPRRDVIAALAGNDMVRGLSGQDLICGGKGHDRLLGGDGRDSVQQQPGGAPVVR